MKLWISKTKRFCETSFKNDMWTRHLASEFQYFWTIFKWMLRKYCACHERVEPRHTNSCNSHAKWPPQRISVTWNLQPFHGFSVRDLKHWHYQPRNPCACHAKSIISDPLEIHHACQRFCNPHKLLRLPQFATRRNPCVCHAKSILNLKKCPRPWCFNGFDFQIALARRRGANFGEFNF